MKICTVNNTLIPESDQHLISPFNITPESHIKVMRIKEMIINWRTSWLLNKFSLLAHKEIYREQYGEYAFWYKGEKGKRHHVIR